MTLSDDWMMMQTTSVVVLIMISIGCLFGSCAPQAQVRAMDDMLMVRVPAGTFVMGSDTGNPNHAPAHKMFVSAYWIDQHEVTNRQYIGCVAAGACDPPWAFDSETRAVYYEAEQYADFPVQATTWRQADEYCAWVGGRLPTEAEWEKAARGTDQRTFPWGEEAPDCGKANYDRCVGDTDAVDANPDGASPYGVVGMAGNVWEWTADWYAQDTYQVHSKRDSSGPATGIHRVIRGGSWLTDADSMKTYYRFFSVTDFGWNSIGFRCVMED
jgi:eukaryotic-like serine/threonine-protein kinase